MSCLFLISNILGECLVCRPYTFHWDDPIRSSCQSRRALALYIATFNLILDFLVVVIPMPILWRLQLPMRRKVALSGMFGMGVM